jgi:hypothetical protein
MKKENLKFWITCKNCQRKIGFKTETMVRYLKKVIFDLEKRLEKLEERLQKKREKNKEE